MNLRESVEQAVKTIMNDQLCASESHCLLVEALKCPDYDVATRKGSSDFAEDINDRIQSDWTVETPVI